MDITCITDETSRLAQPAGWMHGAAQSIKRVLARQSLITPGAAKKEQTCFQNSRSGITEENRPWMASEIANPPVLLDPRTNLRNL